MIEKRGKFNITANLTKRKTLSTLLAKSFLEKKRLTYVPDRIGHLHDVQNAYWEEVDDSLKLISHEIQHSPPLKIGVMFSGGPAPGGLNVIWGLFDAIKQVHSDSQLIGFMNGADGLLHDEFIDIEQTHIEEIKNQGGFTLIGTGRTKIESIGQKEKALETIKKHRLNGLVFIGGDDTNTNAYHLSLFLEKNKSRCSVVGIPKTIDGDLKNAWIESSFGFDTATKTYSNMIGNLCRDAMSAKKYWFFVKLMGRSASHVTLECALQTKPNLAFISEEVSQNKTTLSQIVDKCVSVVRQRSKNGKNYGVILIPEGLLESCPDMNELIQECSDCARKGQKEEGLSQKNKELYDVLPKDIQQQIFSDLDPHGNVQFSLIETDKLIKEMVQERLQEEKEVKFKGFPVYYGYDGRCALPSNLDATYCFNLGIIAAVLVRDRKTGFMASIKGLSKSVKQWKAAGYPIHKMMSEEMRKGKMKEVIAKSLVSLKSAPFKKFSKDRGSLELNDLYESPGPVTFDDTGDERFCLTKTLWLEKEKKNFF